MIRETSTMKGWTIEEVDKYVAMVKNMMLILGEIPTGIVKHFREALKNSPHNVKVTFYKRLKAECPEALPYFFVMEVNR